MDTERFDNRPIGVFDSGYGGLTVARALQKRLPEESILYFGDSARCPYGPRDQAEVDGFVQQICTWLVGRDVKMIVIACNTATAAGLAHAQENFSVPVVGVVEPGARAAAHDRRSTGAWGSSPPRARWIPTPTADAIRHIDAGITVFSTATPRFVEIAEMGHEASPTGPSRTTWPTPPRSTSARSSKTSPGEYLEPLRRCDHRHARAGLHPLPAAEGAHRGRGGARGDAGARRPRRRRATSAEILRRRHAHGASRQRGRPTSSTPPAADVAEFAAASAAACSPAPWTSSRMWTCPHCNLPPLHRRRKPACRGGASS